MRFLRFADSELQKAFLRELSEARISADVDDSGAVVFATEHSDTFIAAAHRVRDAVFPWYLIKPRSQSQEDRLCSLFRQAGLQFHIEYHETGTWLLVRRADQQHHEELFARV
jgi:hypothetical protein